MWIPTARMNMDWLATTTIQKPQAPHRGLDQGAALAAELVQGGEQLGHRQPGAPPEQAPPARRAPWPS